MALHGSGGGQGAISADWGPFLKTSRNFLGLFSARVPKNLDGPRPPQEVVSARLKRGPRAENGGILVPRRVFAHMIDHEGEDSESKMSF